MPDVAKPPYYGVLRLEEVEFALFLPHILRLRHLAWAHRLSLTPDLARWHEAADAAAIHWGVFKDAELVAAGRLSLHATPEQLDNLPASRVERRRLAAPIAVMSHTAVHPLCRGLHLEKALDAARIERADQARHRTLLTTATTVDRVTALESLGFQPLGAARTPSRLRPVALVLDVSRTPIPPHRSRPTRPL